MTTLGPARDESTLCRDNRSHLRSRIAELDALIASLVAERRRLQAESNAIVYPVLSLPPDVTTEIFLRCLPCEGNPRPSPTQAPLLLAQICRQWRQITLHTPALWQCVLFKNEMPVELLHIWLSRSGNHPISLQCQETSRAGALIEASLAHSHHWQDIKFTLPLTSLSKLALHHAFLPMLRSIYIDPFQLDHEPATERVIIQDAPLLREAHIPSLPLVKIDLPWPQITVLTLLHHVNFVECISLLRGCQDLVNLTVHTLGPATVDIAVLTLHSLESLTCNFGDPSILDFLTLPRLERLTVTDNGLAQHAVLGNLIRRSACPLTFFSMSGHGLAAVDTLIPSLRALPDSVSELELIAISSRRDFSEQLFTALLQSMDLLPQLTTLQWRGPRRSADVPQTLIDMLHMRMQGSPSRVALRSLTLHITLRQSDHIPSSSALAQLRALASAGLDITFTVSGTKTITHNIL
ncbi:hypothetical protein B0H19DRAFT_1035635 [Mycena capillaripes]|nr:hypothetical protein B0H19DRAFT_1035635 [Mycena capillaripes]